MAAVPGKKKIREVLRLQGYGFFDIALTYLTGYASCLLGEPESHAVTGAHSARQPTKTR